MERTIPINRPSIFAEESTVGPNSLCTKVRTMLVKAGEVAGAVSRRSAHKTSSSAPLQIGRVHIGNTYDGLFIGSCNRTYVDASSGRKNNDNWRYELGAIATVVGLVTSYFVGRDWGAMCEAEDEIQRVKEERRWVMSTSEYGDWKGNMAGAQVAELVEGALHGEKAIFHALQTHYRQGLQLKVALVASCALTLVGCVFKSAAMGALGGIGVVVVCAVLLFRAGAGEKAQPYKDLAEVTQENIGRVWEKVEAS